MHHILETKENCQLARKLIDDFKAYGLEHAVRRMSVAERGQARRLIRHALMLFEGKMTMHALGIDAPGVVHIRQSDDQEAKG